MPYVSCIDDSYRLVDEIKRIVINLKKSKKIFDPIIHSSSETVRALHYVKCEIESYFRQYEDAFNKYKISLEKIKEFANEVVNVEKSHYFFYPYRHVKDKYEKLLKEYDNYEKILHPILIKVIMNKQERQQDDILKVQKILKTIPDDNKNEKIIQIETIIQKLIENLDLDLNIPRIDSALLFNPPHIGDSKLNDLIHKKHIVKKIYKRGVEMACEPITGFEQNMPILSELKKFNECQNILKFYGLSNFDGKEMLIFEWTSLGSLKNVYEKKKISWDLKAEIARDICQGLIYLHHIDIFHCDIRCENIMMTFYMEPKIANFHRAKHASGIKLNNDDYISNNIINWVAPEVMQKNSLYTQECEVFSFAMLLWELGFQKIPYENMSSEEIIVHVTGGRRESPDIPFYTLDFLKIQRKYLRIIVEGWDNKPEKRVKMDEILLRLSDIEVEFNKIKKNNIGSDVRTLRYVSHPQIKPVSKYRRHPNSVKTLESSASSNFLGSIGDGYASHFTKSPIDMDSFPESVKGERPNIMELANAINTLSPVVKAPVTPDTSNYSEKCKEIISKQKDDGSIELDDSVCNELNVPKEDIINTIKNNITSKKLKLPKFLSSFETVINLSYLKNFESQHEDEWRERYYKALNYLSKQIGDPDVEKELLECSDKYVIDKVTGKMTEKPKEDVVTTKKDEPSLFTKLFGFGTGKEPEKKNDLEKKKEPEKSSFGEPEKDKEPEKVSEKKSELEKKVQEKKSELEKKKELEKVGKRPFGESEKEEEPEKVPEKKSKLEKNKEPEKVKAFINAPEKEGEPEAKARSVPAISETIQTLILDKHIEDIICDDKEPDQTEKEVALDIVKESVTPEVCKAITSIEDDDGRIELNETVCKELDHSKEEIITMVQNNITNKKLKSPELLSTAINLSYLNKAASEFEDQWKDKYNKAREYLSKQIGNADAEKELLKFTDNYVIENCSKKVIKDQKRSAIVNLQSSMTPDKYEEIVSKQKDDGSFELSETICKELIPMEDIMTTVKSSTNNKKLQSPKSDSWWMTALAMSFLQIAAPHHENQWKNKYNKAHEYLSKQIGDENIEKELLKCTNKYVVDRAYEKIIHDNNQEIIYIPKLNFTDEIRQKVHEDLRFSIDSDATRTICNTQQEDGSFILDSSITDHLEINPKEAVNSIKRFVGSSTLRESDDSVWHTAFTIYFIKTILIDHENEWKNAYNNASKWLSKQINDTELEKELFSACEQCLIEHGFQRLYSRLYSEKFKTKLNIDDETRKEILDDLRSSDTADLACSLCSAQESNGSFSQNALVLLHPLIPSPVIAVESLKHYVSGTKLITCADSIWYTVFTIHYFKNVLIDHEEEWHHAYDRASIWITEQIGDAGAEKELYSACEQYLIHQGVDFINNRDRIDEPQEVEEVEEVEVEVVEIQVSEETRKAVHKSLRDDATESVVRTLCNSQESNGSFNLHKSISDHLKIQSIDIAVKSLKSYVASLFLKNCDSSIWYTAFTITYLRTVLTDYEKVWQPACERATSWISQQCKNSEVEKELYSACDQFLIKQGIEILNKNNGSTLY
ncbi:kinase-like protein [Gigaspora margarita]|uniref:Kinase-like protein n=1 Tax=Gigaspora margarita TaxID=4874 RepID=A0A8H3XF38_GIGMA|nr:kinase-like protein [Gigaspora margarita]